jgi:hypothetical protein
MTLLPSSATRPTAEGFSPSFGNGNGAASAAFELKFLLEEEAALRVEVWARRHLAPDPHAEPSLGGAYTIHSLYLDTPGFDVFRRADADLRHKYRVRRYGRGDALYLERKTRWGDRVSKQRVAVDDDWLPLLPSDAPAPGWPGAWFQGEVQARRLRPVCRISYRRTAFVGDDCGPVRLTLDRHAHCVPQALWRVDALGDGLPLLPGRVVLELKYRDALPALFKRLLVELCLSPGSVSKYRRGVEAWKLAPPAAAEVC